MLFADLFFIYLFLPVCLIFYFISKNIKWRNCVLAVFSLIFYAWGEPVYILVLLASVTINYLFGLAIGRNTPPDGAELSENRAASLERRRKLTTVFAVVVDLLMLGVFKYSAFAVENLNLLLPFNLPVPQVALPIGISFYTFQAISYIADCYFGNAKVQKNYGRFLLYISMFPQLVAGPIVRYSDIETELTDRKTTLDDVYYGARRIIFGLAKKVIIANTLSTVVGEVFGGTRTVLSAWLGAALFALQVYFDFSGYSDIAIGLGRIFGFHFNENFNYPFASKTIGEFWQRWHISLGTFFRDYLLFMPIFGKRRGYLNLFLVWFCTGLWHGASWNYIIWGLYFGFFIFIESLLGKKRIKKLPGALLHIYTAIVQIVGFGIFYFEDIGALGGFLASLAGFGAAGLYDGAILNILVNNCFLIAAAVVLSLPVAPKLNALCSRSRGLSLTAEAISCAGCAGLLFISSAMLVNATNNPFLYFRW